MKRKTRDNIDELVMTKIQSGEVRMKPRVYYTLLGFATVCTVILTSIISAYLFSIMFFWIRIQSADTMAYGARANLASSIASFPWWALIASAISLALAVLLARRFGRTYRHRTITVAVVIVACSMLIGLGLTIFDFGKSHSPNRLKGGQAIWSNHTLT